MNPIKAYDIYGFGLDSLETAKNVVEDALDLEMSSHESSFRGGDYYALGDIGGEHFILQRNHDIIDDEPIEDRYASVPILLYVNGTDREVEIETLLKKHDASLHLLERKHL